MAEVDPNLPQVVDPERTVELTRLLQVRGPLGVLNVLDTIVPVVSMGDVVPRTITVLPPAFRTTDIFTNQQQIAQPLDTILADTGALAEGTYDLLVQWSHQGDAVNQNFRFEFRNAANTANLALWTLALRMVSSDSIGGNLNFALEFAANERLRIVQAAGNAVNESSAAVIFARAR
jgi:hypothetical protein